VVPNTNRDSSQKIDALSYRLRDTKLAIEFGDICAQRNLRKPDVFCTVHEIRGVFLEKRADAWRPRNSMGRRFA
jgi:hypothetical protein